jgi:hypothetical protein
MIPGCERWAKDVDDEVEANRRACWSCYSNSLAVVMVLALVES